MLSTVATVIVSFGLSVPVSLGVGTGMIVIGAGMMAARAKHGVFNSSREQSGVVETDHTMGIQHQCAAFYSEVKVL